MSQQDNIIAVLDAGSSKIRAMVAEVHEGALRYRGHGVADAAGMRKGLISDLGPAASSHRSRARLPRKTSAPTVDRALRRRCRRTPHSRRQQPRRHQPWHPPARDHPRGRPRRRRSRPLHRPAADREILHLLPQQFILDEQPGILDPVGMVGNRLEVNLHIATSSASAQQSIITCANRAGLEVTETVFEALAAAEATLSADERELGVCLLDIGASTSELVVFFEGSVAHTSVIPIGGDHFTNDLAVGLHVTAPEAEWLKCNYGHAVVTSVSQDNEVEITGLPGYQPRIVSQRLISEILEPRARELFQLLRDNLRQGGVLEALGAGCVTHRRRCPPAWAS